MNRLQFTRARRLFTPRVLTKAVLIAALAVAVAGSTGLSPAHAASYTSWYTDYTLVDDGNYQDYSFTSDNGLQPGDSVQFCATVHGIWNNRLWVYAENGSGALVSGEYHVHQYCSWYRIPADGELYVFLDNSDGRLSRYVSVRYRYYIANHYAPQQPVYQAPVPTATPAPTATPQTSTATQTFTYWNGTSTIVCTYSNATWSCRAQ